MSMAPTGLRVENSRDTATTASSPEATLIQSTGAGNVVGHPPTEALVVATASRASASASIIHAVIQARLWSRACKHNPIVSALSAINAVTAVATNGVAIATRSPTPIEMAAATERAIPRPLPGRRLATELSMPSRSGCAPRSIASSFDPEVLSAPKCGACRTKSQVDVASHCAALRSSRVVTRSPRRSASRSAAADPWNTTLGSLSTPHTRPLKTLRNF